MQQSFMDILLTDAAAKAVCWTLVHSLWQGLVAALVAGAVIVMTRKSAAVLRYNLLTADLVLFLLVSAGTFWYERHAVEGASGEPANVVVGDGVTTAGGVSIHAHYAIAAPSLPARVGMFLNEHAIVVVMVWMACLTIQLVRMTGGLYRIHRLRHQRVFLPAESWQLRMALLMARMGIAKKVVLLQSGSVKVPVTFGFLKPSILVPLGMLANLPAEQVETILLHELAHIRRGDYLSNLLLHIGEAVFFFNPGVRWVAWLIREEREACCDDLVLAGIKDRNCYFEALIAFGEYALGKRSMALPLGGGRSDLLWRIRRMLNQENKKLHLLEKTILSFGLMAVLAIGLVSMKGSWAPGVPPVGRTGWLQKVAERSAATRVSPGRIASAGTSVVGLLSGGLMDTVPVASGKRAASSGKEPVAVKDTTGASSVMVDSMSVTATAVGPNVVTITVSGKNLSPQVAANMAAAAVKAASAGTSAEVTAPVAPVTTIAAPKVETKTRVMGIVGPRAAIGDAVITQGANFTESAGRMTEISPAVHAWATPGVMATTSGTAAPAPAAPSTGNNAYIDPIIADLKTRGLIQSENPLSFTLNVHGLEVNGVRQSTEIFQVFKEKYITNSKNSFHYSLEGNSISSSVGLTNE